MKKHISLLLSFLILTLIFLSSCDIPNSIKKEITEGKYRKPFTFLADNTASLNEKKTEPYAFGNEQKNTVALSAGGAIATEPLPPPLLWDNSLSIKGVCDSGIVEGGRDIELKLTVKANDHVLTDGELQLVFETKDYKLLNDGKPLENNIYIIDDFFEEGSHTEAESLTLTLSPDYSNGYAFGYVEIWFRFVPDDMDSFVEIITWDYEYRFYLSDYELENGFVSLTSGAISYAADSVETWLARGTSYGDVFNDMSKYHYEGGFISAEEMSSICIGFRYFNKVRSAVCNYDESDHSMNIAYYSKNIRYESKIRISDDALEKAILAHEEFWYTNHYQTARGGVEVTLRILEIMKEKGVITEDEYNQEIEFIDEAKGVYTSLSQGFPGIYSGYSEVDALFLTHKDK